ncbi:MAG: thioesterase family protein [Gammaproteobacteria bacterium]|nr:thioesterase family protein [Gammaproteobacteria bacterium]MBU1416580.1 thioesterase family protein [Gammaproteobacteria bacterium]
MSSAASLPDRSAAEQARLEGLLREVFDQRIRFNCWIGLRVHSLAPERTQMAFDMRDELVGNYVQGRLHGGMIAATLDTVGGLAVAVALAEKHKGETAEQIGHRFNRVGTIDMRVDYLRPGMGDSFVATGRVIRLGGRIASVQMMLENDVGDTIATGTAAYVIT